MEAQKEQSEWLSADEAGVRLDVTDRQVRRYVQEGRLVGRKERRKLFVEAASVEALLQEKADDRTKRTDEKEESRETDAPVNGQHVQQTRDNKQGGIQSGVGDRTAETDMSDRTDDRTDDRTEGDEEADGEGTREKSVVPPAPAKREELDQLFQDVRVMVDLHLRRIQEFHQAMNERIDRMEQTLTFERGRNEEIQQGLTGILRELGLDPESVGKVTVDARSKTGFFKRFRRRFRT